MNLKHLSLAALAALSATAVYAIPAKPGLRTLTQPDGTTISVRVSGDEYHHTYITAAGEVVSRDADGFFRAVAPETLEAQAKRAQARRAATEVKRRATQVPVSGSPRVPVLLLQYSDYKFKDADPKATFNTFFSEGSTSAYQYFVDQSNGKFTPQFDIYGPYTLPGTRVTYGGNDWWGEDKGVGTMVGQGVTGLASQIDFSRYDNDGDGECDVVIVLYAGDGEASSYANDAEDSVWPCQWELSSSDYGRAITLNGTKIDKFAVFNELYGVDMSKIDGIGTFCHEFSHCLGLPDFYDTNYSGYFGMGDWSLMDSGSYNNDGFTPIGYSAYEKEFMNWITIPEVTANTYYTLPVFNQKDIAKDQAIRITNDKDKNEYYIIENRSRQGWDKYIPATGGLLISHVTYSATSWASNTVNDYALQRMTLIPADNKLKIDKQTYYGETYYIVDTANEAGDLWPYGTATELTDTSTPKASVNTGSLMGKPITDIKRNADGTVSFWAMKAAMPAVETPAAVSHSVPDKTSLTVSWGEAAVASTYTIEVKEYKEISYELVTEADFSGNGHGWSTTGYTTVEDGATRLGSSNNTGTLTSPAFTTGEDGTVTVRFNGKAYNNDGSSVKVDLLNASGTSVASQTIALGTSFADYTVVFAGPAKASVKVQFATLVKKKRVILSSAQIYNGDASEAADARRRAVSVSTSGNSRIISGIEGTSYTITGLTEGGMYDYRIKAVPVDGDSYSESAWTPFVTVNLSDVSGVESLTPADNEAPAEYYNLQGLRVAADALTPGIYIVRRGSTVSKTIVR